MENQSHVSSELFSILKKEAAKTLEGKTLLQKSLELNQAKPFDDTKSLASFVEKSISDAKIKAKILRKTISEISHQDSLDLISNMLFFGSWHDLLKAAKSLANLDVNHALSSGDAFKLSLASWKISGQYLEDYFFEVVCVMTSTWANGIGLISRIESEVLSKNLFGDFSSDQESISTELFMSVLGMINANPRQHLIIHLLSKTPFGQSRWGSLANLTVREFFSHQIIQKNGSIRLIGDIINSVIRGACHDFAMGPMLLSGINMFDPNSFIEKLAHNQSAVNADKAALLLLKDYFDQPLLDAIKYDISPDGFAENIRTEYFYELQGSGKKEKILSASQDNPFEIRIYREKIVGGYDDITLNRITSTAWDSENKLLGFAIFTFVKNPSESLSYLGSALDDLSESDLSEMAISASFEYMDGVKHKFKKMLFLSHWEVSEMHRRKGIGRQLIESVFLHGMKGLGKPETILRKNRPSSFPVPLLEEIGSPSFDEFAFESQVITNAWYSCVENNRKLSLSDVTYSKGSYNPIFHGARNLEIIALHHWDSVNF